MNQAIGILGGTFDPIHYGHIKPAQQIQQLLSLAELYLMPCHLPPHKQTTSASSAQRAAMAQRVCDTTPGFRLDLTELERHTPSYTLVTLQQWRQRLPDTPICFLIGMDSLLSLSSWYCYEQLLDYCHLVVSHRPGYGLSPNTAVQALLDRHQTDDKQQLQRTRNGHIYIAAVDQRDISSTEIRAALNACPSTVSQLMPEVVYQYIVDQGLYR